MKAITVTSKLSPAARRMLNYAANKNWERGNVNAQAFTKVGRNLYVQMHGADGEVNPHSVARHMMVCAHTTFNYELVDLDESRYQPEFLDSLR